MKLLRETIRRIIVESAQDGAFMEWWFNREDKEDYEDWNSQDFTKHKEMLIQNPENVQARSMEDGPDKFEIEKLFQDKREIKRYWNENCDRTFWQSGKVKFFHSLNYYEPEITTDALSKGISNEDDMVNLSVKGFLEQYKLRNNKDEMSTYGVYNGKAPEGLGRGVFATGVLIEGRVTFAFKGDAMVESRSKATPADYERHKSSGMPKRMSPYDNYLDGVLFNEEDCIAKGVGECIIDNWSIDSLVYDMQLVSIKNEVAIENLASELGIGVLYTHEVFKK